MVFSHVSGSHTDGSEKGTIMWARVKGEDGEGAPPDGISEVSLHFRPRFHEADGAERKNIKGGTLLCVVVYPLLNLFFPGMRLSDVGRAMINAVRFGAPKPVLEVADIRQARGAAVAG